MARDLLSSTVGSEDVPDAEDGYMSSQQPHYPSMRLPRDPEGPFANSGSTSDMFHAAGTVLTGTETLVLFHNAVEVARQAMQQSLEGSESVGEALKLKLGIDLVRKRIGSIPDEVIQILKRDVERLVLSHNQLSQLPLRMAECTSLTYLYLKDNQLTEVPRVIFRLPKLQVLELSRNRLTRLPEEVKGLKALRVLSVMNNNLERLPLSIGYLENLRCIKVGGNPLDEELRAIAESNEMTPSPLVTPLVGDGKEFAVAAKIKLYLKREAAALESDSSENPLDTPRPMRRNSSIRFPVVPTTSESESGSNLRSPGLHKPPIPARSHYRVASGQNYTLQNANGRRPGVTPLIITSERNRSNSESILQAQATRTKRMGIITRKTPEPGATVEQARTNRNSNHFRGYSHASALREKHATGLRKGSASGSSTPASPYEVDRHRNSIFVRRLSSLPEHKRRSHMANRVLKTTRGVLSCLSQAHSHISTLLNLLPETAETPSNLETLYYTATSILDQIEHEIKLYESRPGAHHATKNLIKTLSEGIRAVHRLIVVAQQMVPSAVQTADPGQIRNLLINVIAIVGEARIIFLEGVKNQQNVQRPDTHHTRNTPEAAQGSPETVRRALGTLVTEAAQAAQAPGTHHTHHLPEASNGAPETVRGGAGTPTTEMSLTVRRLRSDTTISSRSTSTIGSHDTQTVSTDARTRPSRYNGQPNNLSTSTTSSVISTPRSVGSFLIPGTPVDLISNTLHQSPADFEQSPGAVFEEMCFHIQSSCTKALAFYPDFYRMFKRRLQQANDENESQEKIQIWGEAVERAGYCIQKCEILKTLFRDLNLNDPEVRTSMDLWKSFMKWYLHFLNFCKHMHKHHLASREMVQLLKAVRDHLKAASKRGHTMHALGFGPAQVLPTSRSTNGGPVPYINSGPATPMSAALGPAANFVNSYQE